MNIKFLGTGAADWPIEKQDGMTEFRRLSSAIIDGTLLIDPGPQVLTALNEYGTPPEKIKYIINTHRHSDHYCKATVDTLTKTGAVFTDINANEVKKLGKYTVSAYRSNHSTCENAVHFIISDGERSVFYGLDGAWLMYDEVQAIIKATPQLAVLDATIGRQDGDYRIFEHNNLNMVLEMQKTLKPYVGKFCICHMARTLHTSHKELTEDMAKHGITVAFDGLELEI